MQGPGLDRARATCREAADWARDRGVSATDDASYLSEFDHLTLVRLLIAQHRADHDAARSTRRPACWTGCRRRRDVRSRRKSARDPHAAGPGTRRAGASAAGLQSLDQAWAEAPEPDGYVRLFLDEGAPMVSCCAHAEHAGDAGATRVACSAHGSPASSDRAPPTRRAAGTRRRRRC